MQLTRARRSDELTQLEEDGRSIARKAAVEGIVLLENDGTLPIEPQRIALFGTGAVMTVAGGTGSGEVNVRHSENVCEGLEAAGFEIATAGRLDAYKGAWHSARERFIADMREKLKRPTPKLVAELIGMEFQYPQDDPVTESEARQLDADACIYVVARQSGEGVDRVDEPGSFRMTDRELADIRVCAGQFEKTIVVLNVGAPVDVSWFREIEGIGALVLMGQLGMEGGHALADVLSGTESPSGKLAVSWPESIAQIPFSDSYGKASADPDNADYREGVYVGYRYYTSFDAKPAYMFGHGLGYTEFAITASEPTYSGGEIALECSVRNTGGTHGGKCVVQAYAALPSGMLDKERCRLVAFAKTETILPGETARVRLAFDLRCLASYDEARAQTLIEPGDYLVSVGDCLEGAAPVAVVRAREGIVLEQHRNLCASSRAIACLARGRVERVPACPEGIPVVELPIGIAVNVHEYGLPREAMPELEAAVDALGDRRMLKLCVGTGLADEGKGWSVPGAVGHSTASMLDLGIPNLEFCDGPAGIRIQRRTAVDVKGGFKPIDPPISMYEVLPAALASFVYGDPDRDEVVYQFVTGFPAASSVAQTWNVDLAREVGNTVGAEMDEYGVAYWLAPALNIVRNPLCGRNFEYYSEDPLVSGKMAAAVVSGVQSHAGRFACVKHFAANSQETNRNSSSSNLDERVLREIYLRGFEIAVRESRPASVMAAYNKVNGIYATESADLLTAILRDEWGFDGVVMTDWFATGFGHADERSAINAGVDLIMPGGSIPLVKLAAGLATGRLSRAAVSAASTRVLAKALEYSAAAL